MSLNDRQFSEREIDDLVTGIVRRIRVHPEVLFGPSVRGTLAFKEVLLAFQKMRKGLPVHRIGMAAVMTLSHRLRTREHNAELAASIVRECVKGVLDHVPIPGDRGEDFGEGHFPAASGEQGAGNEHPASPQKVEKAPSSEDQTPFPRQPRGQLGFLPISSAKEDSGAPAAGSEYGTKEETSGKPQRFHDRKGISASLLEMLDMQDRQWERAIELDQLLKYYHRQSTREGEKLDPHKRDYAGLRVLVGELEKQEVLAAVPGGVGYRLTARALEKWLEQMGTKGSWAKSLERLLPEQRRARGERMHEVRAYCVGDVFRHISIRQSLKELAKQKKPVSNISRRDLRVYKKQKHSGKKDVVVCLDTSSSMGHQQKLVCARIVAAAIAKAALENGDRIGMVAFDNLGQIIHSLTREKRAFFGYILEVAPRGNTNIGDGIKQSRQLLLRESRGSEKFIIVITDGEATAVSAKGLENLPSLKSRNPTEEYAFVETRRAFAAGIRVTAIRVGGESKPHDDFARKLARVGRGNYKRVRSLREIRTLIWGTRYSTSLRCPGQEF